MASAAPGAPSPFIGRSAELTLVNELLAVTASGTPGCALVTGLPGIGKTRFARKVLAHAAAAGFLALASHSTAPARDTSYASLVEALGPHLHGLPPTERNELLDGLAPLGLLFHGLQIPAVPPLGDPDLERARLTDVLTQLLDRLARRRPLALLIDDIHDIDQSSLTALHAFTTALADRPLLLMLTAEPGDPHSAGLLKDIRDHGGPQWSVRQLTLTPFADEESAALLEHIAGPVETRLRELVIRHCAGRPLFLEAVARAMLDGDEFVKRSNRWSLRGKQLPIPGRVRELLRSRLSLLDAPTLSVARALAVGGPIDDAVVGTVTELPPTALTFALTALDDRGMLKREDGDAVALAHGLLRDVVIGELSPLLNRTLHAGFAATLAAIDPADPRIAEHVREAGVVIEPDYAVVALRRGAATAAGRGAVADALGYADAALEAARRTDDRRLIAEVQAEFAVLLNRSGQSPRAKQHWFEALAGFERLGDPAAEATILRELAFLEWEDGELTVANSLLGRAEERLARRHDSEDFAELLHARLVTSMRRGDADSVARIARELRVLAERIGSPAFAARALLADAAVAFADTDYVVSIATCEEALAAARRAGDVFIEIRAHDQLAVASSSVGDVPGLREHSRASRDLADSIGARGLQAWARVRLAVADLLGGDADAALRETSDVLAFARATGNLRGEIGAVAAHSWVLTHTGRLAESRRTLREVDPMVETELAADRNIVTTLELARASLSLAEGAPHRAAEEGARLIALSPGWLPFFGIATLGEAAARCGDAALLGNARCVLEAIRSCPTRLPAVVAEFLDACAAQGALAGDRFETAAAGFEELGLPFWRGRCLLGAARAHAEHSRERAVAFAIDAEALFEEVSGTGLAREARDLLRQLGAPSTVRRRRRERTTGGLSDRELEVARLVATGRSNAQVATALFISPRTVTTHLDRIYTRLGLASRVALTRYLIDSGLLDDE